MTSHSGNLPDAFEGEQAKPPMSAPAVVHALPLFAWQPLMAPAVSPLWRSWERARSTSLGGISGNGAGDKSSKRTGIGLFAVVAAGGSGACAERFAARQRVATKGAIASFRRLRNI